MIKYLLLAVTRLYDIDIQSFSLKTLCEKSCGVMGSLPYSQGLGISSDSLKHLVRVIC